MKSIHDPDYKLFIELLKTIREERHITQENLGKKVGFDQTFVSKYEKFDRRLDFIEWRNICIALDMPLEEFIRLFEKKLNEGTRRRETTK